MKRSMKKLLQIALGVAVLVVLVAGTTGCSSSDISALSVNGSEVSQRDFTDDLKALRDNATFRQLADRDAANGGLVVSEHPNTVTSALSSLWASEIVRDKLVKLALAKDHVDVTAADRAEGATRARQQFGTPAAFAAFPKSFRDEATAHQVNLVALGRSVGADLTTQDGVNTLLDRVAAVAKSADVSVDPRFGTWDPRQLAVLAPRAPGAPKIRTVNPNGG
jgi:hypothetical protein